MRAYGQGVALARHTGGALATLVGAGHFPHTRDPVKVNLLFKEFVDRIAGMTLRTRGPGL